MAVGETAESPDLALALPVPGAVEARHRCVQRPQRWGDDISWTRTAGGIPHHQPKAVRAGGQGLCASLRTCYGANRRLLWYTGAQLEQHADCGVKVSTGDCNNLLGCFGVRHET